MFLRAVDILMNLLNMRKCLAYLDGISILSNNLDEHLLHAKEVITVLRETGITHSLKSANSLETRLGMATSSVLDG